jgi:hypothetical protein
MVETNDDSDASLDDEDQGLIHISSLVFFLYSFLFIFSSFYIASP